MVDNSVLCDHTLARITGFLLEHDQLFAVIAVGAGTKFLPCNAADLFDADSFEARCREYFDAAHRHAGDWPISLETAMRQGAAA